MNGESALRRHLALAQHAVGAAARRRDRTLALIVALAFIAWLFGAALMLTDALAAEVARGIAGAPSLTVQRLVGGRPALLHGTDDALMNEIAAMRGVAGVTKRVWGYLYVPSLEANVTIIGRGTASADAARDAQPTRIVDGRLPSRDAGDDPPDVALGRVLAEALGLRVGDRIALPAAEGFLLVEVVGLFDSESALRTADVVWASDATARRLLGMPEDAYTDLAVELRVEDEASVIAGRIPELRRDARVIQRSLIARTYALTFDARGGVLAALLLPALAALLLITWDRLTSLGAEERREIGVLKALGWRTSDVLVARLYEQALVAITGALFGVSAAYLYVFELGAPGMADILYGWSALYPPLQLTPSADPSAALSVAAAVIVPFVAVGLIPTFRAALIDPMDALRGGG